MPNPEIYLRLALLPPHAAREKLYSDIEAAKELCIAIQAQMDVIREHALLNREMSARSRETIRRSREILERLDSALDQVRAMGSKRGDKPCLR
jgi:hypothetical protein